jgi:hypothetical protein
MIGMVCVAALAADAAGPVAAKIAAGLRRTRVTGPAPHAHVTNRSSQISGKARRNEGGAGPDNAWAGVR